MPKTFLFSAIIIIALAFALSLKLKNKADASIISDIEKLTEYRKPEHLKQHQRPEITVDEASHPRWVTSIEESSLRGSRVDLPNIQFNQQAITQLSADIRFYFSYFLSLDGEMAFERIQQLAYDNMHTNYPPAVANELFDLFWRYQLYFQALSDKLSKLTPTTAEQHPLMAEQISQKLRKHFFSTAESAALFTKFEQSLEFTPKGRLISEKLQEYEDTPDEDKYQKAVELFGETAAKNLHPAKP